MIAVCCASAKRVASAFCQILAILGVTQLPAVADADAPPLLLISLDGFRHDYAERADTPSLDRIAAMGVRADALIPVFPTKTFPNHYSIATGLHPETHGIVDNVIWDPVYDAKYRLADREEIHKSRWWSGEPIWVTAQRQGLRTAPLFWPGSEAQIAGYRPTWWQPYDHHMPHADKVEKILGFFDLPEGERPRFVTLYYPDVDGAGHRHGPDSPETLQAVEAVDRSLGELLDGLQERSLLGAMHLIVVSDHGMREVSSERVIVLDDLIDLDGLEFVRTGELGGLRAPAERLEQLDEALSGQPHLNAYRREETPPHLHYRNHLRIPPLVLLPDPGWLVLTRREAAMRRLAGGRGAHGYDPSDKQMHGIFYATGPRIPAAGRVAPIHAVDLYELMCSLLDLQPFPNEGDILRMPPTLRSVIEAAGDSAEGTETAVPRMPE